MWPLVVVRILSIAGSVGSIFYLWQDYQTSKDIEGSVSQMEQYIELLSGRMGVMEFLENAWPSLLVIGLVLLTAFVIATPQRRRERVIR